MNDRILTMAHHRLRCAIQAVRASPAEVAELGRAIGRRRHVTLLAERDDRSTQTIMRSARATIATWCI
jgi:hypothetical protein